MAAVTTAPKNFNFSLTAVIGQESIKLALLLAAINVNGILNTHRF
jgi:magnesium chelatase subunit D